MKWLKKKKETDNSYNYSTKINVPASYSPQAFADVVERLNKLEVKNSQTQEPGSNLVFPDEVFATLPTIIQRTILGVMLCYEHDFPDFCFWGMRKALIDAIRIRFLSDKKRKLLCDENGEAFSLPKMIERAKQRYISGQMANDLTARVKVFGDTASHDYMANLQKEEVPAIFDLLRIALARMFYPN